MALIKLVNLVSSTVSKSQDTLLHQTSVPSSSLLAFILLILFHSFVFIAPSYVVYHVMHYYITPNPTIFLVFRETCGFQAYVWALTASMLYSTAAYPLIWLLLKIKMSNNQVFLSEFVTNTKKIHSLAKEMQRIKLWTCNNEKFFK